MDTGMTSAGRSTMPGEPHGSSVVATLEADAPPASRSRLSSIVLLVLTIILVVLVLISLKWPVEHDAPLMLYVAYLIDTHDFVPYRDIYDFNLPGTYFVNRLVGRVFGYGDAGFRLADLSCFAVLIVITATWLGRFGRRSVWCAAALFGLVYFSYGPMASMQREFTALLPISAAIAVAVRLTRRAPSISFALVGFLFGLTATIKPHLAIGLPAVWWFQLHPRPCMRKIAGAGILALATFCVPILATGLHIYANDAWPSFVDIVRNYWPLYGSLCGDHSLRFGWERVRYVLAGLGGLTGRGLLLIPAVLGAQLALQRIGRAEQPRRLVVLLVVLAGVYMLYVAIAAKFWPYHWLPCLFFVSTLGGLCYTRWRAQSSHTEQRALALILGICVLLATLPELVALRRIGNQEIDPRRARVSEIENFLTRHLQDGDTVQPLDWTGGAVEAMLRARARIATPYLYDFYLYHHVDNPYIQALRNRFVAAVRAAEPRFVIFMEARPAPWGPGTSRKFVGLYQWLRADYRVARHGKGYRIYEAR